MSTGPTRRAWGSSQTQFSVAEPERVEEAGEGGHVAGQPLGEHFLAEVVVDVPGQGAAVLRRVVVCSGLDGTYRRYGRVSIEMLNSPFA